MINIKFAFLNINLEHFVTMAFITTICVLQKWTLLKDKECDLIQENINKIKTELSP